MSQRIFFSVAFLVLLFPLQVIAETNNLALTPQMGWNDWNTYACGISEAIVTNNANVIVANGMKAAGYQFVNIDDCWQISRDSNGVIVADPGKFPDGIPWLANYVHSVGLKFGLYTDHGTNTCQSKPGSYDYEYVDAFTYGSWGVDYLKNDECNLPTDDVPMADYFRMADGLMKSGQPILNALCPSSEHYVYWTPDEGNSWRTTDDIGSTFDSMISKIDQNSESAYLAGPGRWNDPDMLEIGNGDFASNLVAAQTHFTMWCIMAAPLIAGNNVTTMSAQSLAILTNTEAIAVDQDPAGEQGEFVGGVKDSAEVWSKSLGCDFTTRAVALLNRSSTAAAVITCNWTNLAFQPGTTATVRDLWAHQDLGTFTNSFTATIPAYGSMLLKIVGTPIPPPTVGTNYLTSLQPVYAYCGWGEMTNNKSIGGNPITLNGIIYTDGIGTHAIGGNEYILGGICSRFHAVVGVDDEVGAGNGSVIFQVIADGRRIYDSGIMTGGAPAQTVDLDMTGVRRLTIGVTDTGNDITGNRNSFDHSDWADALVIVTNATPQVPETPTGLVASSGNAITLAWNNTLAATSYNVKRATDSGGTYTTITNVPITTFTDSSVVSGTNYFYVVSAVSGIGEGSNSLAVAATPCAPPPVPTFVSAAGTNSQILVSWNASAGATSYSISRFTSGTPPVVVAAGVTATNFTDSNVVNGTIYYYLVAAANACSQSANATFVPAIVSPAAPTGLNAIGGNAEVVLNWNASVGASGYNVKRSATNGEPYLVIGASVTGASYSDYSVVNGATYYYVVSALNAGGESADSAQASVMLALPLTACWTNTVTSAAQSWNANANWTNASAFPNSPGELAIISANIASPQTINLNQAVTLGSLELGAANGAASYTLAANGGSLTFSAAGTVALTQLPSSRGDILAAPVSIATNLVVINDSTNPLTLAGNLSSSGGALTIGSGTLVVGDGTTNGSLGSVSVADNGALVFNRSDNATNAGVLSGSGSITQTGTGILTLSSVEAYTGATTVTAGTLALSAGNDSFSGLYLSSGLIINNGATVQINVNNALAGFGSTVGSLPVTINADGTLTGLGTANSGTGTSSHLRGVLTLNGGTLSMGGTQINTSYGTWDLDDGVVVNGGTTASTINCLDVIPSESGGTTFNVANGGTSSGIDLNVTGTFINGGSLNDTGIIKTGNGTMALDGNNGYSQGTTINGGTLQLGAANDSVALTSPLGAGAVANNATLSFASSKGIAISRVISGGGTLLVSSGTNILTANNTYSGPTEINAGALVLKSNGSISNSATITVASGATLDASQRTDQTLTLNSGQILAGLGTLKGNVIVGSGATLSPGNSIGTLMFSNNLLLNGGSTTVMKINKSVAPSNDVAQVAGALTCGGTLVITNIGANVFSAGDSFKLFNATNYSGAFTNIVPAIPAVNLAWNTNGLTGGILSVVSSPTARPKFGTVNFSGNSFVFSGTGGVPDWTYYLLASTNLVLPLASWTVLATNTFDGAGNFLFTNAAAANRPQIFYLLRL